MRKLSDYAVYRGDAFLFLGKARECADYLGVTIGTLYGYTKPSYIKRVKNPAISIFVFKLEDDESEGSSYE